jgi:arylsulfatase A-like enzyme
MEIGMYDDAEYPKYPRHPGKVTDRASMRKMIDGYDTGVRYVDDQIGRMVNQLKAAGVYEETAIIISADHGENLGELGIYAEHGTADEYTCHIPFIVKWPGGRQGAVDTNLQYNLDWAPTLMDLLGKPKPDIWDGQSFADAIKVNSLSSPAAVRDQLVISQCCHVCQRSVRWENWLYIRTYHDGFRLFAQEMLFDLTADPHEEHDLALSHPEVCREGAWRLMRWHDDQMQKVAEKYPNDAGDPLWTVISEGGPYHALLDERSPLPKYLKRLEATGRADGAAKLREKYSRQLERIREPRV